MIIRATVSGAEGCKNQVVKATCVTCHLPTTVFEVIYVSPTNKSKYDRPMDGQTAGLRSDREVTPICHLAKAGKQTETICHLTIIYEPI